MTVKRYDVLGFGAVAVDELVFVDEFPSPNGKTPIVSWQRAGGGLAGTALVAVARLGQKAAYCGVLDRDELSRYTLDELQNAGVDCAPVLYQAGARPIHSVILVSRGSASRSILFSHAGVAEVPQDAIQPELIGSARVLFVDHTAPDAALAAARLARAQGIPVVADVERADFPQVEAFLAAVDHLILGIDLARELSGKTDPGECAGALFGADHTAVVVTAGELGCWYVVKGSPIATHQPALKVPVVDTTGCGDVFHGAYAACLSWGGDVPDAVKTATIAAGRKASQPGGRAGIPDRPTVEDLLAALEAPSRLP
jgi:ribokinase